MKKIDLKKELKEFYSASVKDAVLVDVPEMTYIMVDGTGDPNTSQDYRDAIETLYALSYTLKFMFKKGAQAVDYGVMPLEGLWWMDDMEQFGMDRKDDWKWTAMIMQPGFVTVDLFQDAVKAVEKKKNPAALGKARLETLREGMSAQIMHIGPYAAEGPTIAGLHRFIGAKGYKPAGKHHEIYLSDPRKAAPEKLKTIVRQPLT